MRFSIFCMLQPLAVKVKVRMISYSTTLISSQELSFDHIIYNILFELDRHDICSVELINALKNILNECGLSYIWRTQAFTNEL